MNTLKEFAMEHPIITLLLGLAAMDTIGDCVNTICGKKKKGEEDNESVGDNEERGERD